MTRASIVQPLRKAHVMLEALEPRTYLSGDVSLPDTLWTAITVQNIDEPPSFADRAAITADSQQSPAPAIVITSPAKAKFTVGKSKTFAITTTGSPASTLSEDGQLPSGIMFTDNGNGTASLSGTPEAGSGGKYDLTITASSGSAVNATQSLVLHVHQEPAFTSAGTASFTTGTSGSFQISVSGFPVPAILDKTTLPQGLTFSDNGNGTAVLSGKPAGGTGGSYQIILKANNDVGTQAKQSLTLNVDQHTVIRTVSEPSFVAGTKSKFKVKTTGFPIAKLTESGPLPSGLTFRDNQNGTAKISGSPVAGAAGIYDITIVGGNGLQRASRQSYMLTVNESPVITSATSVDFVRGTSESFTVSAFGFPTPTLLEDGALPDGITFTDSGNGTAILAGTPEKGSAGTYLLKFFAKNGIAPKAKQRFILTVDPPAKNTA